MREWITSSFWLNVLESSLQWMLTALPRIALIVFGGLLTYKLTTRLLEQIRKQLINRVVLATESRIEAEKRLQTLFGILNSIVKVGVGFVLVLLLLRQIGLDIAPLIAGAGVVGLAVGFGAQNLVKDVISGFFILLENQVRIGDVAVINGTGGLVESIGLRTVTLRDIRGVVHIFQNGNITMLSNMTKEWSAALFDIGVAYKENVDHVIAVMRRTGEELSQDATLGPDILEPLEVMGLETFGDNSITIRARFKTKPLRQFDIGREYNRRIKEAFDREGIEIPFPQRTLHVAPSAIEALVSRVDASETLQR